VRYRDGIGFILEPILAAVLIVQGVAHGSSGLGRILNWSWVSYLGTISYSIYLYHPISIGIGRRLAHKLPLVSSIAALAVVIIVSSLSYLIVEKPMLRLRSRLHRRKVSRSEPESAAELTVSNHA
jgi:peptidoglycan/LPS O-acetylase OafA/YrhL